MNTEKIQVTVRARAKLTSDALNAAITREEWATIKRINRKLAQDRQRLHAARTPKYGAGDLGAYYITDAQGTVTAQHIDVWKLARELGVWKRGY